jgi:DNA polymerase-3 subunit delta
MLILLYGEDTFRSRQKLKEIVDQYRLKHQSGLDLIYLKKGDLDFDKVRRKIESVSMFNEKKLVIIEDAFNDTVFQENFLKYLRRSKLKENQNIVVVFYQAGKLTLGAFKNQINMKEEFRPLEGNNLINWLKKQSAQNGASLEPEATKKLIAYVGNNLWQLNNELNKLASYKTNQVITERDVDLMVRAKLDVNIFKTLDALAQRDKKTAFRLLHKHLSQGENAIYLFTMFVYQVRSLLKLKDLIDKGVPYYQLAQKSGLHPFVVKKSSQQLKNFSLDQLKRIYQRLLEVELSLKKGRLDGPTALDLLVAEI